MTKEITAYRLFFKNRDETPIWLTKAGGEELMALLRNDPPLFIDIKGQSVARSEIATVQPVYKP